MKPRVLILYYSFTRQTHRVSEAMASAFQEKGCDAELCAIEFIDERYRIQFPFRPFWTTLLSWLWPQMIGATGAVRVPPEVFEREYDLICIGSPTWWLNPAMPISSFLKTEPAKTLLRGKRFAVFTVCRGMWWNNMRMVKKLARRLGGIYTEGAAFTFSGNQLQSALSFISYFENGINRDRYCGVKIYEFGIPETGIEMARSFAHRLVSHLPEATETSANFAETH